MRTDGEEQARFKAASGQLRRGDISPEAYFTTQAATLRKLAASDIGSASGEEAEGGSGCEAQGRLYAAVIGMFPVRSGGWRVGWWWFRAGG